MILICRYLLGGIFFLSGLSKLFSPTETMEFIRTALGFSDSIETIVVAFSIIEIGLSLSLVAGLGHLQIAAAVSCLFSLGFITVGVFLFNENQSCGCFGSLIESKVDTMFLVRSIALLGLSLVLLRGVTEQQMGPAK